MILVIVTVLAVLHFAPPATPRVTRIPCAAGTFPGRVPPPDEHIFVGSDEGDCVYFDRTGKVVMRHPIGGCRDFIGDFATTQLPTSWGYLSRTGQIIQVDGANNLYPPSEGMARFQVPANRFPNISWKYGYIDLKEAVVSVKAIYDHGGNYSDGLARVNKGASNWNRGLVSGGRWGYIDRSGNIVIPITLQGAGDFSEGLAPAAVSFQRWGYIDRSGAWVIPPQFESAEPFSDGLARVRQDGKTVFVGRDGRVAVTSKYQPFKDFAGGLARVMSEEDDYWQGFIDHSGGLAVPTLFSEVKSFSEGLAAVSIGPTGGYRKWGFIDKSGAWVIEPRFFYANSFRGGLAKVYVYLGESHEEDFYIDRTGKQVWPVTKGADGK